MIILVQGITYKNQIYWYIKYPIEKLLTKEYNDLIVPKVFLQIKKSKFVVADLTQQNQGDIMKTAMQKH